MDGNFEKPALPVAMVERILYSTELPIGTRARVVVDANRRLWWCEYTRETEGRWFAVDVNPPPFPVHARSG